MKLRTFGALGLVLVGCGMEAGTYEDEQLGTSTQEIVNPLPEFPYNVLPVRFVFGAGAGSCLGVRGSATADNSDVTFASCDANKKSQDWFLVALNDGSFQIRTGHFPMMLSMRNGSMVAGETAQTWGLYTNAANTRWAIVKLANGEVQLKNVKSGLCLATVGVASDRAEQKACASANSYRLTPKYAFPFSIMAKHSQKCLNVASAGTANGTNVQQYTCVGADNERFYLQPDSPTNPSYYYFKARHSNKCLDIAGGSLANNGNAQQYDCVGVTNERWTVQPAGEGFFYIKNVNSGKCLTVTGAGIGDQNNVDQYTCVSADNQKWRWNYFTQKQVQLVRAHNSLGGGIDMSSVQWAINYAKAAFVFRPHGIELQNTTPEDVNYEALHYLGLGAEENKLRDCAGSLTTSTRCAEIVAARYPGKIVVFAVKSLGGLGWAHRPYVQIAGGGYVDTCADNLDQCAEPGIDNVYHLAHELGHWFGNYHTWEWDNDDMLADTEPDTRGPQCDGQLANPPAASKYIMSGYRGCFPGLSGMQGGIARLSALEKFAGALF